MSVLRVSASRDRQCLRRKGHFDFSPWLLLDKKQIHQEAILLVPIGSNSLHNPAGCKEFASGWALHLYHCHVIMWTIVRNSVLHVLFSLFLSGLSSTLAFSCEIEHCNWSFCSKLFSCNKSSKDCWKMLWEPLSLPPAFVAAGHVVLFPASYKQHLQSNALANG